MKKIIQFLIIALTVNTIYSQKATIKWSNEIPHQNYINISGGFNGKYLIKADNKENNIVGRIYNSQLEQVSEKIYNFNFPNKTRYNYQGVYFLKNQILHFLVKESKKDKRIYSLGVTSDLNLNLISKNKILLEEETKYANKFAIHKVSPDSTKVLSFYKKVTSKKSPEKLVYKVHNANITEVLHEGIAELPIKNKDFSIKDVFVDNFANVYVSVEVWKERKERTRKDSKTYYKLIVFSKNQGVKEFNFDYPEREIENIAFKPGKNNSFFCTGFLSKFNIGLLGQNNGPSYISDEMFFVKLDSENLSLENSKKSFVKGLYTESKKGKKYMPYLVKDIFEKSDGGYSVVSEQHRLDVLTSENGHSSYIYNYCDIACIQLDSNLNITSTSKIPKYQKNAKNPSIKSTFKNDSTYIVYEDLTSNMAASNDKEIKKVKKRKFSNDQKNSLILASINPEGKIQKDVIYNYKDSKIRTSIEYSMGLQSGKILFDANDRIGILSIE